MKPKLLFVYDHPKPDWWMDGLSVALDLLEEQFDISRQNLSGEWHSRILPDTFDFILGWGAFGSGVDKVLDIRHIKNQKTKYGLCIAGNALPPKNADTYDVLFYETDWVRTFYLRGVTTKMVKAFGVNTDLFSPPQLATTIVWDYIGVGALANWKRWEKMIAKKGTKLVVGEYQLNNEDESLRIAQNLLKGGVMVGGMVSPYDIINYYYSSRSAYMPADINGGGERSVLEAIACGLNVEVEDDNPKLQELLEGPIPTHRDYALALKQGIMEVLV